MLIMTDRVGEKLMCMAYKWEAMVLSLVS